MPLFIIRQDITKMHVDAIVNTTNEEMVGYSGVDLAVHTIGGKALEEECRSLAPLGLGEAKLSGGHGLPCEYVIHTHGPVWQGGRRGERIILRSCYTECLKLAVEKGLSSVAFPLISSGAYGYPKDQVLRFAVEVISDFLYQNELTVYLCVYDKTSYSFSRELFCDIKDYLEEDEPIPSLMYEDTVCNVSVPQPEKRKRFFARQDRSVPMEARLPAKGLGSIENKSLHEYMKAMDKSFAYKLFDLIDQKGMTDVECYKKANVDKKTFSKIKCNPDTYKPSKPTAVAFAIALELDLDEAQDLLASAGMTLSRGIVFDKIIRYFIQKGNYNIFEINEALFEFDQVLLGC